VLLAIRHLFVTDFTSERSTLELPLIRIFIKLKIHFFLFRTSLLILGFRFQLHRYLIKETNFLFSRLLLFILKIPPIHKFLHLGGCVLYGSLLLLNFLFMILFLCLILQRLGLFLALLLFYLRIILFGLFPELLFLNYCFYLFCLCFKL